MPTENYTNNGIIAGFMGGKPRLTGSHTAVYVFPDRTEQLQRTMTYQYNWNKLAPVAKKIVDDYYNTLDVDDLIGAGGRFDIEEVYSEVVRMIKAINNIEP